MKKIFAIIAAFMVVIVGIIALGHQNNGSSKTLKSSTTVKISKSSSKTSQNNSVEESSSSSSLSVSSSSEQMTSSSSLETSSTSESATSDSSSSSSSVSSNTTDSPTYDPNKTVQGIEVTPEMVAATRKQLIAAGLPADQWAPSDIKKIITEASQQNVSIVDYAKANFHN
ncbi:hypothetical protein FGL74_01920 [Leuconostoc koreense]|nr:hypothetical protein FGL74_01920 [Leuconostoc mesenteroides]QGM26068.1 hypothetical protein GJV51_08760 [Leuconostoc mesenteroides subsp. mesenteroides]